VERIISELHYLPCVKYFSQLIDKEELVLEFCENYQKISYRNRCQIVGANGILSLSIPLSKGKNQETSIREVKINYDTNWAHQHWQSIKSAYGKSPFWEFYSEDFEKIFLKKHDLLFDFNLELLRLCLKILKIKINISFTETFELDYTSEKNTDDQRNQFLPKHDFLTKKYPQIFEDRFGFTPNLSILDLIFCAGNQAKSYL
jgi:hypothetical protein